MIMFCPTPSSPHTPPPQPLFSSNITIWVAAVLNEQFWSHSGSLTRHHHRYGMPPSLFQSPAWHTCTFYVPLLGSSRELPLYRMAISLLIHVHGRNMMKHAELNGNQCQPTGCWIRCLWKFLVFVTCLENPESSSTEFFGTAFLLKINPFRRLLNVFPRLLMVQSLIRCRFFTEVRGGRLGRPWLFRMG
jgi:hypothetical protein